jgi:hypothetical protein
MTCIQKLTSMFWKRGLIFFLNGRLRFLERQIPFLEGQTFDKSLSVEIDKLTSLKGLHK